MQAQVVRKLLHRMDITLQHCQGKLRCYPCVQIYGWIKSVKNSSKIMHITYWLCQHVLSPYGHWREVFLLTYLSHARAKNRFCTVCFLSNLIFNRDSRTWGPPKLSVVCFTKYTIYNNHKNTENNIHTIVMPQNVTERWLRISLEDKKQKKYKVHYRNVKQHQWAAENGNNRRNTNKRTTMNCQSKDIANCC